MNNSVEITEEYLKRHATAKFGWNRGQLAVLGVSWPPAKGWKKLLIGKTLTLQEAAKFESFKTKTRQKEDSSIRECRYCSSHDQAFVEIDDADDYLLNFKSDYEYLLSKEEKKALSTALKKVRLIRDSLSSFISSSKNCA